MLFLGMVRSCGKVAVVPDALYGYRVRPGSASRKHSDIDGFQIRYNWAKANWGPYWPEGSERELEKRFWSALAQQSERAYWARRKELFHALTGFMLANWPASLPAPAVVRWPWYPDWLWAAKNCFDRLYQQLSRNFAKHDNKPLEKP
jgi:hypothetical protein